MKVFKFLLLLLIIGTMHSQTIVPDLNFTSDSNPRFIYSHKTNTFKLTLSNQSHISVRNAKILYEPPRHLKYVRSKPEAVMRKIGKKNTYEWFIDIPRKTVKNIEITVRVVPNVFISKGIIMSDNLNGLVSVFLLSYLGMEQETHNITRA